VFDKTQANSRLTGLLNAFTIRVKSMGGVKMSQGTWRDTKGHHWFDEHARNEMPLIEVAYGGFTTPMKGKYHVVAHRDTKLFGRIGAVARYDTNRVEEGEGFLMF